MLGHDYHVSIQNSLERMKATDPMTTLLQNFADPSNNTPNSTYNKENTPGIIFNDRF